MWMREPCNRPRFLAKTFDESSTLTRMRGQYLDGDVAVYVILIPFVDSRHATMTDQFHDLIFAERAPDQR